jgi:hypothetical protein
MSPPTKFVYYTKHKSDENNYNRKVEKAVLSPVLLVWYHVTFVLFLDI